MTDLEFSFFGLDTNDGTLGDFVGENFPGLFYWLVEGGDTVSLLWTTSKILAVYWNYKLEALEFLGETGSYFFGKIWDLAEVSWFIFFRLYVVGEFITWLRAGGLLLSVIEGFTKFVLVIFDLAS